MRQSIRLNDWFANAVRSLANITQENNNMSIWLGETGWPRVGSLLLMIYEILIDSAGSRK